MYLKKYSFDTSKEMKKEESTQIEIKYFGDDKVEDSGFRTLYLAFLSYLNLNKIDNLSDVRLLYQNKNKMNIDSFKIIEETFSNTNKYLDSTYEKEEEIKKILTESFSEKEEKDKTGYYALTLEEGIENMEKKENFDTINKNYVQFAHTYNASLQPFISNVFQILKFIDNSEIADKKTYVNLVRAQLSSYELLLLFYHSVSDENKTKLKNYIEKYNLFKHLQKNKLIHENHTKLYKAKAFI